jgi:hypothetical protein
MAKARKSKPREHLVRWRVSLITATPAKFIDFTLAPDVSSQRRRDGVIIGTAGSEKL